MWPLRLLLTLRLKQAFQVLCQCGFIFRTTRIELQRESDLGGFVNNFSPEVDGLPIGELNLQPYEFFHFHLASGEDEAPAPTEVGNSSIFA